MQSAQIAWPPQATIVQALQTPDAYYASGPKIITVTDRQVRHRKLIVAATPRLARI